MSKDYRASVLKVLVAEGVSHLCLSAQQGKEAVSCGNCKDLMGRTVPGENLARVCPSHGCQTVEAAVARFEFLKVPEGYEEFRSRMADFGTPDCNQARCIAVGQWPE